MGTQTHIHTLEGGGAFTDTDGTILIQYLRNNTWAHKHTYTPWREEEPSQTQTEQYLYNTYGTIIIHTNTHTHLGGRRSLHRHRRNNTYTILTEQYLYTQTHIHTLEGGGAFTDTDAAI